MPLRPSKPRPIRTVSFVSLGCPKNLVDSEKMLGLLAQNGIIPVPCAPDDPTFGGADAVVVNTCGFLEASKEESLGVIKEAIAAKERGEVRKVVVAGCLVQRHRAKMLDWAPGIDSMVGVFDRDRIVEAVFGERSTERAAPRLASGPIADPKYWIAANALIAAKDRGLATAGLTVNGKDAKGIGYFEDDSARLRLTPRHYAYLRISEGCNQNCAFCTIPSIRGKMRSKSPESILKEARELIADGAFELLLIGQDTTSFGDDVGIGLKPSISPAEPWRSAGGLPALLAALSDTMTEMGSRGWLRLMYAYPTNFSPEIIRAFGDLAKHGRLIPYLDIPLQHASDSVLAKMRRNVTRAQQAAVIKGLREAAPGMAIRTTFISGFPGETEDDHHQLLDFIREMRFEAVGVFEYSQEEGTVAGTMEKDPTLAVSAADKARRRNEVMEAQQEIAFERAASLAAAFDDARPLHPDGTIRGHQFDVVIDAALKSTGRATTGVGKGGRLYQGRTYFQAPQIDAVTYVQSKAKLAPGELVRCVVTGCDGYDLVARPVSELIRNVPLSVLR